MSPCCSNMSTLQHTLSSMLLSTMMLASGYTKEPKNDNVRASPVIVQTIQKQMEIK